MQNENSGISNPVNSVKINYAYDALGRLASVVPFAS